ncbi:hypothetical protein AWP73_09780 [Escherichia coli]|nr:hypothetical protein AWP73_09780 [Escherichia coli]
MMSLWDALRMNMMISYQELVRTFLNIMFHNFIVSGSIIFMTKEILCANIFCLITSETFLLFK